MEETFKQPCDGFEEVPQGVSGAHHVVEGKFGEAVHLGVPDGRFVADASKMEFDGKGTIEFWVRPRPMQRLWWDQGWHYFIHCEPAEGSDWRASPRLQDDDSAKRNPRGE